LTDVRFAAESDRLPRRRKMARCAISDQSASRKSGLFDHLISAGKHAGRDGEAERLSSLAIDKQLKLRCLLHRQVGWLLAL
jgi:hypothetical protein